MRQKYSRNYLKIRQGILAGKRLTAPEMARELGVSVRRARELGNAVCTALRPDYIASGCRLPEEHLNRYGIWDTADETGRAVTPYQKNIVGHLRAALTLVEGVPSLPPGEQPIADDSILVLFAVTGKLANELLQLIIGRQILRPPGAAALEEGEPDEN